MELEGLRVGAVVDGGALGGSFANDVGTDVFLEGRFGEGDGNSVEGDSDRGAYVDLSGGSVGIEAELEGTGPLVG